MKNFEPELNEESNFTPQDIDVKTPWYKNLLGIFISPTETFTDLFSEEKPKGMAIGMISTVIFGLIMIVLAVLNPSMLELWKQQGLSEAQIASTKKMALIGGSIGGVIAILFVVLVLAIFLKIGTGIIREKATFKELYIVSLFSIMVQSAVGVLDVILAYFAGVSGTVLGISVFLKPEQLIGNPILTAAVNMCSIASVWGIILLIIGYKVVNKITLKKSAVTIIITKLVLVGISTGATYLATQIMPK